MNEATATTALYLIISTVRQFSHGERSLRAGTWKSPTTARHARDLSALTLSVIGLGGIGLRLAEMAHVFPMRVLYYSRRPVPTAPEWCEYFEDVEDMLSQTDVLSVHVPYREDTHGLVGEKWIRCLKKGAIVINTARGKVVDEDALLRGLEDGHVCQLSRL